MPTELFCCGKKGIIRAIPYSIPHTLRQFLHAVFCRSAYAPLYGMRLFCAILPVPFEHFYDHIDYIQFPYQKQRVQCALRLHAVLYEYNKEGNKKNPVKTNFRWIGGKKYLRRRQKSRHIHRVIFPVRQHGKAAAVEFDSGKSDAPVFSTAQPPAIFPPLFY